MDITTISAFAADHAQGFVLAATLVSLTCRLITSMTPTPPPGSRFAAIYRAIELIGAAFGYAKDHGLISPPPELTVLAGQAAQLGHEVVATLKAKPDAPQPLQVASDATDTLRSAIALLRAEGVLPPAPSNPNPAPATPAA